VAGHGIDLLGPVGVISATILDLVELVLADHAARVALGAAGSSGNTACAVSLMGNSTGQHGVKRTTLVSVTLACGNEVERMSAPFTSWPPFSPQTDRLHPMLAGAAQGAPG
jgi:hypothetical protein